MKPSHRLLAVSLRVANETAYQEIRDALARDWWPFLKQALPGWLPLLIPNDPPWAADLCALPDVGGLLLTGGNDIGTQPLRDEAETAAFLAIRERGLPVLGVCRGAQLLCLLHGGTLAPADSSLHRACRHEVVCIQNWPGPSREVNSFHGYSPVLSSEGGLEESARSADGAIEAFRHHSQPVAGILWHPEREPIPQHADLALFERHFGSR